MSEFVYKEIDQEGFVTLDAIAKADRFNKWMFDTIRPHLHGRILEIGSGIGNISQFFIAETADITMSDIRANYRDALSEKFDGHNATVIDLDIVHPDFDQQYAHLLGTFDSVFALNVVEHIFDDRQAIANCHKLLRPNGHIAILVPAYQTLFNDFDRSLEHYRRYTKATLHAVMSPVFDITHRQYFNFAGIFGWYLFGTILRHKILPEAQVNNFNFFVPIFRLVDKLILRTAGLSVIIVGRK